MTLSQTSVIDFVVKSKQTGGFDLLIIDGGEYADEMQRYNLLLEKLSTYAEYVVSGQFAKEQPESAGKELRLCFIWDELPPNESMKRVEAIKPPNDPTVRFPVVFLKVQEYLPEGSATTHERNKKWWKFW